MSDFKQTEMKLRDPIKNGSELISALQIRKPKAKDIRSLPGDPKTGDILDLAGRLCGQPPSVIDELSIEDCSELLDIVGNFMVPGQKTGSKV
jgi:Phage tail assembly chaperone proteins, E, or 41 or 14